MIGVACGRISFLAESLVRSDCSPEAVSAAFGSGPELRYSPWTQKLLLSRCTRWVFTLNRFTAAKAISRNTRLNPLETFNQQQEILRIRYRLGEGDTSQFLESQVKGDGLRGQLVELESLLSEKVRELGQVTGWEKVTENPSN